MPSYDRRGLAACGALLFFGLVSALAIQASVVDGRLPYNTTTANLIVELVKFASMLLMHRRRPSNSFAAGFRFSMRGSLPYSVPALMFAVQNQLVFHAVAILQPAFFQLASKLKFVSTAVLARIVMKKQLTTVQWIGIVLLMLALVVSKSQLLLAQSCQRESASPLQAEEALVSRGRLMFGMILVTCTSTISGASGIANEFLLKRHDEGVSLFAKNAQLYFWGALFNGVGMVLEMFSKGQYDPFRGFNYWACLIILLRAVEGVSISFIMMYMDNIVKCFVSAGLVYTTALSSYCLFDEAIDGLFMLGLTIASLALVLYFGSFNDVLSEHAKNVGKDKFADE